MDLPMHVSEWAGQQRRRALSPKVSPTGPMRRMAGAAVSQVVQHWPHPLEALKGCIKPGRKRDA